MHCVPFLLLLTSIHVIRKTDTRTTTIAATTTITSIDVIVVAVSEESYVVVDETVDDTIDDNVDDTVDDNVDDTVDDTIAYFQMHNPTIPPMASTGSIHSKISFPCMKSFLVFFIIF